MTAPSSTTFHATAYPPWARLAAAVLTAISRVTPLVILALLTFTDTRLANQLRLTRTFTAVCLAPAAAAWLLRRAFAATVTIANGTLIVARRGQRIEVPAAAIARLIPWRLPIPQGGVSLHLQSGRRFGYALAVADPVSFLEALADAGVSAPAAEAAQSSAARFATAKSAARRPWDRPVLKYVVFGLVPTLPLFRVHQWIAYGGTFGEYYSYGLQAYLLAFGIYWATLIIYVVLYAAALRVPTELIAWVWTVAAPERASVARQRAETAHRVLYYLGVPALLLRVFLR